MSPKRQVALLVAIFATLGIGVSVAIIAAGGGFGGSFSNFIAPPTSKDIFHIGQNVNNGTTMVYSINSVAPESSLKSATVTLRFVNDSTPDWKILVSVKNGTAAQVHGIVNMSNVLTLVGQPDDSFKSYYDPIRLSIFSIRDMDYQGAEKYLYVGAPWNSIDSGTSSVLVKISGREQIQTPSGTYNAFVLAYKLGANTSKLWIDSKVPLPVKAEVYDAYDNPQYSFELIQYTP